MANIISSPADLIRIARNRETGVYILMPHAYEAAHSLGRLGMRAFIIASAPSIAGKICLLSIDGALETAEDLAQFRAISPLCGMKDGRVVNTTGHVLMCEDYELHRSKPATPIDRLVHEYRLQRVDDEWYYYHNTDDQDQGDCLTYIYDLSTLNTFFGVSK